MLLRGAFRGLSLARAVLGHDEQAADAARRSGLGTAPAGTGLTFGGFWANGEDGFRFTSPRIPAPGTRHPDRPGLRLLRPRVHHDRRRRYRHRRRDHPGPGLGRAVRPRPPGPPGQVSHLILTHAHWDHVGGADALRGPGTRVIAQAGFPAGLDRERDSRLPFRYFTGAAGEPRLAVTPDQLVSQPTALTVGGTDLVLYPAAGGETSDALLVHLPASGVLFAGDVLALPRPAVHGRGVTGGTARGACVHRPPAAPSADPRPPAADRSAHRRRRVRAQGGADSTPRRGARPRSAVAARCPTSSRRPASLMFSASTRRRSSPIW